GDETQGGQPKTCQSCHNLGPIQATVAISVLDSANVAVTQYRPGNKYKARVTINATGQGLNGYGFQMIALRDSDNSDLDGFSDVNPNNYKIASIPGGRTYAEHNNISPTNTFDVTWTAPATGTGSVTFYAAGNGVNSNGNTSGDGAGSSTLKLTEFSSATADPQALPGDWTVSPNPVTDLLQLSGSRLEPGHYRFRVFSAAGQMVWEAEQLIQNEAFLSSIPASDWQPGVYFVQMEQGGKRSYVKVLKL
ncbi:MAG: T9SS type A sorting domain-containing protein, partial [Saprospiraceae bacterium]|nr:T9SS type A sorting domain-containing protein [Saprospiraceae bacterium]